jgi:hypothetical protein
LLAKLTAHPPWRQLVLVSVALPLVVATAVLAFAWPAANLEPRDLPVGVIGAGAATGQAVMRLEQESPGAYDLKIYGDVAAARHAIEDRDVYGAIDVSAPGVTVYSSTAASSTVATLLDTVGNKIDGELDRELSAADGNGPSSRPDRRDLPRQRVATRGQRSSAPGRKDHEGTSKRNPSCTADGLQHGSRPEPQRRCAAEPPTPRGVSLVDVVPADPDDPRGVVLSSALLPLTICSLIIAAAIALALEFGPAWRMIAGLLTVSVVAGFAVYAAGEWWLGVLPHHAWAIWGSLSLLVLAMSSTTAGLISLIGSPGLGVGAALMVFIGNPFSGSTSAPELLPDAVDHIGQWLPPGAGANLVRSATYFDGNGAEPHVVILLAWIAFGVLAIFSGHHSFTGFAARRQHARTSTSHSRVVGPVTTELHRPAHR